MRIKNYKYLFVIEGIPSYSNNEELALTNMQCEDYLVIDLEKDLVITFDGEEFTVNTIAVVGEPDEL